MTRLQKIAIAIGIVDMADYPTMKYLSADERRDYATKIVTDPSGSREVRYAAHWIDLAKAAIEAGALP